jgi:hypothetical protein
MPLMLMRGMRSTLALCTVAVSLGGYAYFIEADRPNAPMADPLVPVFDFESGDITTLTVTAENGDRTVVDNTDARWRLLEPFEGNVDVTTVVGLASSIATLEMQRVVAEPEDDVDLAAFGLNEPRITVDVATSSVPDASLLIGARTPTGGDVYATLAGSRRVFLMSGYLDDTFNQSTFDLRDKTILNFTNDEVEGLEITGDEVAVQLRKTGDRWGLTSPIAALADAGAADGVIGRLSTGQIASVESENPDDLTEYGLVPPRLNVNVRLTGSTATLLVGGAAGPGRIYARDGSRDQVFTIDETLVGELVRDAEAYRRKEMFGFRPFNAKSLSLERGGVLSSFERNESTDGATVWRMVSPSSGGIDVEVDGAAMDDLLAKLSNLRAESFIGTRDGTGLTTPVASFRATFRDSDEASIEERVIVGRSDGDGTDFTAVFAVNGDEPGAARLNPQAWDDAMEALDALTAAPGTTP